MHPNPVNLQESTEQLGTSIGYREMVKYVYLVFAPSSWHRALKSLRISGVIGVSFDIQNDPLYIIPELVQTRDLNWAL